MRSYIIHQSNRSGSAIVAAMLIALCLAMAGAAILGLTSQHARSVARVRDHIQAQMIAEAGANAAFSLIKADWSARLDPGNFPWTPFSGGSYDATVTPVGNVGAVIQCVGECRGVQAEVIVDVKQSGTPGSPGAQPPAEGPYKYAVLAGSILFGGNGQTDVGGGDVHSNSSYDMNGTPDLVCDLLSACESVRTVGSGLITGDATSPEFKKASPGNISGVVTVDAPDAVSMPELDLTPYYQYALANGEVYNGYAAAAGTFIAPAGGVMWVNGDVFISGNCTIQGCIVATGDIKITGNTSQNQVGDLPAYVSRDGDIELNSSGQHHGLVYAMNGDIKMTGGGKITGTVLAAGEYWKNGGWDQIAWENSTPPPDPNGWPAVAGSSEVGITCWHK